MTIIVTDSGFSPDTWGLGFDRPPALALAADVDPAGLSQRLAGVLAENGAARNAANSPPITMIRIDFPDFADGRGFGLARRLRQMGYGGRLRAGGHVIADQYAMARRCGFDEVEISDERAARQPEDQWLFRANWRAHDYQTRLRG